MKEGSDEEDKDEEDEDEGEAKKELLVKNMSFKVNENSLEKYFGKYGTVTKVKLVKSQDGKSKGFGFVEFKTHAQAQKAMDAENGNDWEGRPLNVSFSSGYKPP
mmetsp:Transcript_19354/g.14008  ORF Transcript_19354/g.14008 Transcript_19354/m.14008 type:complete len:104 (+) Transcript_19354:895-1206(+)